MSMTYGATMKMSKMVTLGVQRGEDWHLDFFLEYLGWPNVYISFAVSHTTLKSHKRVIKYSLYLFSALLLKTSIVEYISVFSSCARH